MKKFAVIVLVAVMLLSALAGCGASAEREASVQSVSMICGLGATGLVDRFAGMVTAQSETQIKKADNTTVDTILVKVDQEVKAAVYIRHEPGEAGPGKGSAGAGADEERAGKQKAGKGTAGER